MPRAEKPAACHVDTGTAYDPEKRIEAGYAENRIKDDLLGALKAMKAAFGDPMTRRTLGGHNERQQAAILAAAAAIQKATA